MPMDKNDLLHPSIALVKKLRQSLKRMKLKYVDVNLMHGPVHPGGIAQVAEGMADCVKEGMALTVGVSNYSAADMLRFAAELKDHGIPLATNECEYSILRRHPEIYGLMQTCDEPVAAVALNYNISKGGAAARWDQKRKDGRECSGGVGVEAERGRG